MCIFPNIKIKWYKLHATVHGVVQAIPRYYPYFSEARGQQEIAGDNCNAVLGFLLPQRQTKLILVQKSLAHNRKISNNLAMITVM